ncbi:MAG: class I SAM-dependent methyltransferase [Chloroflexia bacterium]|nr:class I SAM-dependent methyltransferase [Chloroflexia bacterium]
MRKINSDSDILKEIIEFYGKTVVDVGCGTGDLVRWIANENATVIGIDTPEMIEKAQNYPKVNNEKYSIGKGEELPVDENFADVMTFMASFHHIPYDLMFRALDECYRVLKPKGVVILVEPVAEKDSYYEIIKLAEDEADIQNKAYQVLKNSEKAQLILRKKKPSTLSAPLITILN